jgi:protein-disulfide isomerase
VKVELGAASAAHPTLRALAVRVRQGDEAWTTLPGFASTDGATVLLGELRPLAEPIATFRRKLLAARPRVRGEGKLTVTEFLDFQCERCKRRTPEARRAAAALGGTVEVRFLPLVKQHEWSFAAAECAAALAEAGPAAFLEYEDAVFARSETMSAAAARELARDVAEAANGKAAFETALSSGRARQRVLQDIELASRLGVHGTPSFVLDGKVVPGERGYLENALMQKYGTGR